MREHSSLVFEFLAALGAGKRGVTHAFCRVHEGLAVRGISFGARVATPLSAVSRLHLVLGRLPTGIQNHSTLLANEPLSLD